MRCPTKSAKKFNAAMSNPIVSIILLPFTRFKNDPIKVQVPANISRTVITFSNKGTNPLNGELEK